MNPAARILLAESPRGKKAPEPKGLAAGGFCLHPVLRCEAC